MAATLTQIPGNRKAALLLVALGQERAARILRFLSEEEVEKVMTEVANLGPVEEPLVNQVMKEFVAEARQHVHRAQGGIEVAKELLAQALGSSAKAEAMLARIGGTPAGSHFRALTALDSAVAASLLGREHPQTIALVISKLPPDRGLAMLRELPDDVKGDVAYRIATLSPPSPEAVKAVEAGLERRIISAAAGQRLKADSDPLKTLVEILIRADGETEREILESMDEVDPQLAQDIRQRLFTIEDLVKLEDKALQLLLRQVDTKELALALKGTSEAVRQKVYANLSERAQENLKEEMDLLGPQRLRDVEKARKEVVRTVRQLEQEGSIVLSRAVEDYVE
ncbi:MAG: flagellar motor switch protein FliG [Acidimicrobiales bacterium]